MPMFEYRCTRCGHEFEELVFGDETPVCPACRAEATEKLISKPCRHCEGGSLGDFGAPSAHAPAAPAATARAATKFPKAGEGLSERRPFSGFPFPGYV